MADDIGTPTVIKSFPGEAVERARLAGDYSAVPNLVDPPKKSKLPLEERLQLAAHVCRVAHLLSCQAAIVDALAELRTMKTCGIIEIAIRNQSVSEYMRHWESRAEKAERALAEMAKYVDEAAGRSDKAEREVAEAKQVGNDLLYLNAKLSKEVAGLRANFKGRCLYCVSCDNWQLCFDNLGCLNVPIACGMSALEPDSALKEPKND